MGEKRPFVSAIVVAAGSASRMEGIDKQFAPVGGIPCLARTLLCFEECREIGEIVVVTREESIAKVADLCARWRLAKVSQIVRGGESRQQSAAIGLACLDGRCQYLAVHDGARPLCDKALIRRVLRDAIAHGGAAAAVPVKDTIKVRGEDGFIDSTPDRATLFACQTPQIFEVGTYRRAMEEALAQGRDYTDDCQLFESAGRRVYLSQGSYQNIKITTPEDLALCEQILAVRGE